MRPSQHLRATTKPDATPPASTRVTVDDQLFVSVRGAIQRTRQLLLDQQHRDGYWCGELEGDTILESEYILLLAWLEQENSTVAKKAARYIVEQQLPDGGWALYPGGDLEISCSVKAYFALKLTGHDPDADCMLRARRAIMNAGGADQVNSFTRFYLALLGQISYDHCPAVPPEAVLLPNWLPINIHRVSAWSRTILVPLSIMWAHRPARELPAELGISELFINQPDKWPTLRCVGLDEKPGLFSWDTTFRTLDRTLKSLERLGIHPLRKRALKTAEDWMVKRFVASDGLGAIFPPIIWSVVALKCLGYDDESLESRYCHEQLERLMIEENDTIRLQPCKSPVWDTALTLRALAQSGLNAKHESIRKAIRWLLEKEVTRAGDWAANVKAEPSGWFFEHHNDFYPDVDDTIMVLMALGEQFADSRLDDSKAPSGVTFIASEKASSVMAAREQVAILQRAASACERGRRWVLAMQNSDGGWGAFDKDNDAEFLCHVPFADHNAMIDPSTPDITARVLEAISRLGGRLGTPDVDRALQYLRDTQESDGSWYGRWGVNYIYGTWQALVGLSDIGVSKTDPMVTAGVDWLLKHQQSNGGWGETARSYDDPALRGQGPTTASQTAWALLGLMAAGSTDPAVEKGVRYLLDNQREDGGWDEPEFTGTGFPRVFYLRYHMYPTYFPLLALGRWAEQVAA